MVQVTGINRYSDLSGTSSVATSAYTYDLAGRLTKLDYKHGSTNINSFAYAYDAANRLTQETSVDGTSNYTYDDTDQLLSANHTTQANEAYTYDANGNRTNAGYGTGTNNQLLTDGKFNYQYDDEGNRTQKTDIVTGELTDYGWDEGNRLTQITVKNATGQVIKSIVHTYDVYNQRIAKVVDLDGAGAAPATTERFIYDSGQISLVFDGQGNQTHRYLYGNGVDQILADETTAGVRWAVTDKQGTVTDVIDSQGQVLNHLVYDSFGKITSQSNPAVEFRYGFTGREFDAETGDYYYRARYYDAGVGRFIGEDPLGFGAGDANLTRYVFNSPTNYTDSSGEFVQVLVAAGAGVALAVGGAVIVATEQSRRDLANDLNRLDIGQSFGRTLEGGRNWVNDRANDLGRWISPPLSDGTLSRDRGQEPRPQIYVNPLPDPQRPVPLTRPRTDDLPNSIPGTDTGSFCKIPTNTGNPQRPDLFKPYFQNNPEAVDGEGIEENQDPNRLTGGGRKAMRNLEGFKDMTVAEAIKARGGAQSNINQVPKDYQQKTVAEIANLKATGDEAADTALKMVKQASSKKQKYSGK
jgi:RHS repeat-associated protein